MEGGRGVVRVVESVKQKIVWDIVRKGEGTGGGGREGQSMGEGKKYGWAIACHGRYGEGKGGHSQENERNG